MLPIVAIVGEPNVGKSTLLNKIAGGQFAVTSKVAGTTRDRQYIDTVWNGLPFTLVDTAGITFNQAQVLETELTSQIEIALDQADLLLFVVDGKQLPQQVDRKALRKFRNNKVPAILVINKVDSPNKVDLQTGAFQALGVKPVFAVSSVTGRGLGDLLDYIVEYLKKQNLIAPEKQKITGIGVSIVGKPNVGKSSIFNSITKEQRVIVSPIPGTTRTAIDTELKFGGADFTFIDTAGLKRRNYQQAQPDVFAGFQTFKSIRRSDVCLLVIDASQPITSQDQHLAQEIVMLEKGLIILANKIDLYRGTEQELRDYISYNFPFLWMSPLFFVSAKTGQNIEAAMAAIAPIVERRNKIVPDDAVHELLTKKLKQNPPRLLRDQKNPKVFSLKQIGTNPPSFELGVNYPAAISQQFRNAIKNAIMKELNFWGTTIRLVLRGKDKK